MILDQLAEAKEPQAALDWAIILKRADRGALKSKQAKAAAPKLLAAAEEDYSAIGDVTELLPLLDVPADEAVPWAVRAAARVLEKEGEDVGMGAAVFFQAVSRYGRSAEPHIVRFARDEDPHVRAAAVNLLAAKGVAGKEGRAALERAEDDPDPRVREAANGALRVIRSR